MEQLSALEDQRLTSVQEQRARKRRQKRHGAFTFIPDDSQVHGMRYITLQNTETGKKDDRGFVYFYSADRKHHESLADQIEKEKQRLPKYAAGMQVAGEVLEGRKKACTKSAADALAYACMEQRLHVKGAYDGMRTDHVALLDVRERPGVVTCVCAHELLTHLLSSSERKTPLLPWIVLGRTLLMQHAETMDASPISWSLSSWETHGATRAGAEDGLPQSRSSTSVARRSSRDSTCVSSPSVSTGLQRCACSFLSLSLSLADFISAQLLCLW